MRIGKIIECVGQLERANPGIHFNAWVELEGSTWLMDRVDSVDGEWVAVLRIYNTEHTRTVPDQEFSGVSFSIKRL